LLTDLRTELRALFTSWAVPEDAGEDALLVISELIANVIDHARTPFRLTVHPDDPIGPTLQVAVEDSSTALPVQQPYEPYAVRGRGLQIVDQIATRWGYQTHHNGKTVWATLDLANLPPDH
jgi:anti-sigma regulatory factor (Ser/Thr protein kinase)